MDFPVLSGFQSAPEVSRSFACLRRAGHGSTLRGRRRVAPHRALTLCSLGPQGQGKPRGKPAKGKGRKPGGDKGGKAQNFSARPPRKEKQIDPDNPFAAALMGLKDDK